MLVGSIRRSRAFTAAGLAVAMLCAMPSFAADPAGKWNVTMDAMGRTIEGVIAIKKGEDGLTGTWTGQRGESELKDVKFQDGKLTFAREVNYQGQAFDLNFEGAVEGDKLTGMFITPMGDLEATGAREMVADAGGVDSGGLAGEWEVTSDSQLGVLKRTLVINEDLSGKYISEDSEYPLSNVSVDGKAVKFDVTVSAQGQELPLSFEGAIDGDSLKGDFLLDGSDVADVTGVKLAAATLDVSPIVGKWNWVSESQLGVIESKFTVNEDGTATLSSDEGAAEVRDLKLADNKLNYAVTIEAQGQVFDLTFDGSVEGDNITGVFEMEGMGPVADVNASRAASGLDQIVGKWNWVSDSQLGVIESIFTVTEDGVATLGNEDGAAEARNLKLDGDKLTYDITLEAQGQTFDLIFDGSVTGKHITGTFEMEGMGPVADVTATRAPTGLAALAGKWNFVSESQLGTNESILTINEDGAATLGNADGAVELENFAMKDGEITFDFAFDYQGQVMDLKFKGTEEDGTITGNFEMEGMGPVADITATRAPSGLAAVVGEWDFVSESQLGTSESILTIKEDGAATLGNEEGAVELTNFNVDGDTVTFDFAFDYQGQVMDLTFDGNVAGDTITGNFEMEGMGPVADVNATRRSAAAAAASSPAHGLWNVKADTQIGILDNKLQINPDGTGVYYTENEEAPISEIKIDGANVEFEALIQGYNVTFKGKVDGDQLTGEFIMGSESVATLEGSRASEEG